MRAYESDILLHGGVAIDLLIFWFKKFALFEVCALNLQPFNHSRVSGEMLTT